MGGVAVLLDGRVVLISGTGPGLGSETARTVLREGGRVVLGDRLDRVEVLRRELDPDGSRSIAVLADITDPDACERLAQAAAEAFGRLDAVVNVAAVDTVFGGLMSGSLDDWDLAARVNVQGALRVTKAAVPLMESSGGGAVVFIGSIGAVARDEQFEMMLYGATKGAMVTAAWYLARELGPAASGSTRSVPATSGARSWRGGCERRRKRRAWTSTSLPNRYATPLPCATSQRTVM